MLKKLILPLSCTLSALISTNSQAAPVEYELIVRDQDNSILYDLGFSINKDFPGLIKDESGSILQIIDSTSSYMYYYITLTRDGLQRYDRDNWYTPADGDDSNTDYFFIRFAPGLNQLFANLDQDQIAPGKAGYTIAFDGVSDFNDTWYEQVTRVTLYDFTVPHQTFDSYFSVRPKPTTQPGDCDADGTINLADAITDLQVITAHRPPFTDETCDINEDTTIGIEEALYAIEHTKESAVCDHALLNPEETFSDDDSPATSVIGPTGQSIQFPWGYNRPQNSSREYPVVINGCWGEGSYFSQEIRKKYPAFYMTYQKCSSDSEGAELATLIDTAIGQGLRIDKNRMYLTGFSKGGSGSYKLVRGFLSEGELFAGIIRLAGQSETVLPDAAVEKTSIWYHIGDQDTSTRVQVAENAYNFLKNHSFNQTAVESKAMDTFTPHVRNTRTLTRNGIDVMKLSVYMEMGHTTGSPYSDPELFDWLFGQSLLCW